jgi:hypothetical protein
VHSRHVCCIADSQDAFRRDAVSLLGGDGIGLSLAMLVLTEVVEQT